jgi:hypothetical protein
MSLENIDIQAFSQHLLAHFSNELAGSGLPPEEIQDNIGIIEQFNNIAVGLLREEAGIELPGATQVIPWDEKTAVQGLTLFAEGIYLGMIKCYQQGIPNDIKKKLLQEFAMDVYNQAKQVVASTYGQEHTPEFQLSHEQQVALINQAASNALMFYVNKHEQEYGPIEAGAVPAGPMTMPATTSNMVQQVHPPAAPQPTPQPAQQPVRPRGATPHDKYGAVALLLTTLPASQRARVLQQFNEEEKELISFYSAPQHIEQNLDLTYVEQHLKRFKAIFKQASPAAKSQGHAGLARLAAQYPMEKLLSYVKDERPAVKQALLAVYQPENSHPLIPIPQKVAPKQNPNKLPSRIEDILYQHLQRRLEVTPQRA